jgi:hypothetical protein
LSYRIKEATEINPTEEIGKASVVVLDSSVIKKPQDRWDVARKIDQQYNHWRSFFSP